MVRVSVRVRVRFRVRVRVRVRVIPTSPTVLQGLFDPNFFPRYTYM